MPWRIQKIWLTPLSDLFLQPRNRCFMLLASWFKLQVLLIIVNLHKKDNITSSHPVLGFIVEPHSQQIFDLYLSFIVNYIFVELEMCSWNITWNTRTHWNSNFILLNCFFRIWGWTTYSFCWVLSFRKVYCIGICMELLIHLSKCYFAEK